MGSVQRSSLPLAGFVSNFGTFLVAWPHQDTVSSSPYAAPSSAFGIERVTPDKVALVTTGGKYVTAVGGGGGALQTRVTERSSWELFTVEVIEQAEGVTKVALKTANGQYVTCDDQGHVIADRIVAGAWETFLVEGDAAAVLPFPWPTGISLKSLDHGRYVSCRLETMGAPLTTEAPNAGPWEQFHVEKLSATTVALRAPNGKWVRVLDTGEVQADAATPGAWETLLVERHERGVALITWLGTYLTATAEGTLATDREACGGWETFEVEGLPAHVGIEPLVCPIGADHEGWWDQGGVKPLFGASWFPALRILRDDPERAEDTLDLLASWGVQVVRSFIFVCHPDYWGGREVVAVDAPGAGLYAWPDFDALVVRYAQMLRERGMAWFVTAGDLQLATDQEGAYRRTRDALLAEGLLDVVCFVDVNEPWQNGTDGDNPQIGASWVKPFADYGVLWSPGAHSSSDGDLTAMAMVVGAPVETIHGPGGTDLMVRHIFNHRYEGPQGALALSQGEPRGPGEDVSAGRVNETSWVALAAAMACLTGQLYILHCSRGIRDRDDDDPWETFAPYFQRSRALVNLIPEGRMVGCGHGGNNGSNPEALFCSTRSDGAFDLPGEFHRADATRYESGRRAAIVYGGTGDRGIKVVRDTHGAFYNTHGEEVRRGAWHPDEVIRFSGEEAGDGLLYVEEV